MRFIVKPDPGRDEYVEWSSIVESPTRVGSRADFLRELVASGLFTPHRIGCAPSLAGCRSRAPGATVRSRLPL